MDNSFLLDAMDWSYSRVNSFDQCPRMFYLTYLQCADRVDNAFAQWGTLVHSLLERYYREQVELWDLTSLYEKEYSKTVKERFPFPRSKTVIMSVVSNTLTTSMVRLAMKKKFWPLRIGTYRLSVAGQLWA